MNPKHLVTTIVVLTVVPAVGSAQRSGLNPHGILSATVGCDACHTTEGWRPTKVPLEFDHSDVGFPLTGKHGDIECTSCHLDLLFNEPKISTACL